MAGQQMAMLAVRPSAVHLVETLLGGAASEVLLRDVVVAPDSPLVGAVVADLRRRFLGMPVLLALKRGDPVVVPLPEDLAVRGGDALALVGTEAQLRGVEALCSGISAAGGTAKSTPAATSM